MQHKTLQTSQNTFRSFPFLYEFQGGAKSERTACLNLNRSKHYPKPSLTALLIFIWALLSWIHATPYGHISGDVISMITKLKHPVMQKT